jgi:hypothetical protein
MLEIVFLLNKVIANPRLPFELPLRWHQSGLVLPSYSNAGFRQSP